jgi:CheY-like chemotaxis protein
MATVLVVDDEREIIRLLADFLKRLGHQVWEARSGAQAVTLTRERRFDVVFLDIVMPGMDGNEALRILKAENPETIVIMISGAPDEEAALRALDQGAFEYVRKPFDFRNLERILSLGLAMRA